MRAQCKEVSLLLRCDHSCLRVGVLACVTLSQTISLLKVGMLETDPPKYSSMWPYVALWDIQKDLDIILLETFDGHLHVPELQCIPEIHSTTKMWSRR